MADRAYRDDQWARRFEPHVAPINRLVEELGAQSEGDAPPYVAPMYRGVRAPVLAVLRDPGPKAGGTRGSGFLSVENDDQTAERQCRFFAGAGLAAEDVLPWNAYPWYINAAPTRTQLVAGVEPLRRLIDLLPRLRVILLLGKDAQAAWRLFTREHPELVRRRDISVLSTYHPSRGSLQHPDPVERARREDDIRATLGEAAVIAARGSEPLAAGPVLEDVKVEVHGRPATFATASERAWKAAVAAAVGERDVPRDSRFAVEVDFRLPVPVTSNDAWDLDNLLKPTLDALGGVIGWRQWNGRPQADDERIDRITATKRTVAPGEQVGATVTITVQR